VPNIERKDFKKMRTRFNTPNDPNPARLIESLRCLGYDNYIAIADLVDNSMDAEAERVTIKVFRQDNVIKILVADNGAGMDRETLDQSLRLGSLTAKNPISDLGKFGMGLVTAGLSLARRTTVITKQLDVYLTAIADVDEVIKTNTFHKYLDESSPKEKEAFDRIFPDSDSGTLVILEKCDGITNQNTSVFASTLRNKLGRFHRYFLRAEKVFTVNDEPVVVVDPLELDDPNTQIFSDDVYPVTLKSGNGDRNENIHIRIALIPDEPTAGEREVALGIKNQGFYILRNNREIQAAETLDAFTKHNDFNRMRGEVFLSGDLDKVVGIDFTKRDIVLEQSFRDQLLKYLKAQCTTIKSQESSKTRVKQSAEIDDLHKGAQRSIDQKAKLLVMPKTEIEKRHQRQRNTITKPEPKEKSVRSKFRITQPSDAQRCKFDYAKLGANGQIFECELIGRTIAITWNVQHPFYQRFIIDQRSDGRLVSAVDFLVYSMASAELTLTNDDNIDMLHNLRSIISTNVRTLLT